jgi:hypothetical protein
MGQNLALRRPTAKSQMPKANRQMPRAKSHPPPARAKRPLPPAPPPRYAALFQNWEREGLALALLATTGWSLRYAVDEALAAQLDIGAGSGSIKRLFRRLEKVGLVGGQVYSVGDLRAAILWLTAQGKAVATAMGYAPVPSEWEILLQAHGGVQQANHAALCCVFAYQARRRGYQVQLCPPVAGPAQPDVLVANGQETLYVEVEAESGEPERRMRKWRNNADLQGCVALCANTERVRQRLVAEARLASPRGLATDVSALVREEGTGLWVERWGG